MKKFIFAILSVLVLTTSCTTTRYVTVPEIHTDTLIHTKMTHDSILVRDSIYLHEYTKGDTVHIEKTAWKTRWRDRLLLDTIYIHHTDTISLPYPQEVEVDRELTWWQSSLMALGYAFIFCTIIVILVFISLRIKP